MQQMTLIMGAVVGVVVLVAVCIMPIVLFVLVPKCMPNSTLARLINMVN